MTNIPSDLPTTPASPDFTRLAKTFADSSSLEFIQGLQTNGLLARFVKVVKVALSCACVVFVALIFYIKVRVVSQKAQIFIDFVAHISRDFIAVVFQAVSNFVLSKHTLHAHTQIHRQCVAYAHIAKGILPDRKHKSKNPLCRKFLYLCKVLLAYRLLLGC